MVQLFRAFPTYWRAKLDDLRSRSDDVQVNLVLNVQGQTAVVDDYEGFSIEANFMSPGDLSDYVEALRNLDFFTRVFLDEEEFIRAVIDGSLQSKFHDYHFTYCPAINSLGPGRRAFLPGLCNHFRLATLNNNPYSATIGRHKHHAAKLLHSLKFPTPETWLYQEDIGWLNGDKPEIGAKIIIKPSFECSSIGIPEAGSRRYDHRTDELLRELTIKLRQPMTIQSFISGDEFEVVVLELEGEIAATPVAVIDADGPIGGERTLDYQKVRSETYGYASVEADHPSVNEMCLLGQKAAKALGFVGVSRVDMRLSPDGKPFIFDVSSTPDLTKMSSCSEVFRSLEMSYDDLWLFAVTSSYLRSYPHQELELTPKL